MSTGTAAIKFENVGKCYGERQALNELSLEVRRGEVFGLLGPNGAGKTTAMHIAVGLIAADSGSVRVLDGDPREPALRQRFGIAPQKLSLYEEMTGRENLEFFAHTFGMHGARCRERVDAALRFVALEDRQSDRVSEYSGGMQRRLNIAAAMVHEPELVLLDEPTVGVDPQSRNAIFDNVLALKNAGHTVVYTTHYMEEAERLCDRIAIVDQGRLLALDTLDGLVRAHGGEAQLSIERAGRTEFLHGDDPVRLLGEALALGPVDTFQLRRPTLEQVFLKLTGRQLRDDA
ncbi:MAG: ABC transporter ATP-binding protein [Pseudomonadota bacterium]|nr:ABC transporter ATP-binding protein [Pseudomonadota bacterium]